MLTVSLVLKCLSSAIPFSHNIRSLQSQNLFIIFNNNFKTVMRLVTKPATQYLGLNGFYFKHFSRLSVVPKVVEGLDGFSSRLSFSFLPMGDNL